MKPVAAALLLLTLPLWSCASDDQDPPAPSTTTTTLTPEAEVEAAYLAYWDMADRLVAEPNPESQDIAQRTVGPAQETLVRSLTQLDEAGQELHAGERVAHDIQDVTVDGDGATLWDCSVDESISVQATTGSTIDHRLATDHLEVTLVREGGKWLVESIDVLASWDGVMPCGS